MLDPASPIADFYPATFELDMEGKRQDWEAVVVLEFIAVQRLLDAERRLLPGSLTPEEVQRNGRGYILEFSHHPGHPGTRDVGPASHAPICSIAICIAESGETHFCTSTLPSRLGDVKDCNSVCVARQAPPPIPDVDQGFVPQLVPGTIWGQGGPAGALSLHR